MSVKHEIDIQVIPLVKGRIAIRIVKAWAQALLSAHFNTGQELSIRLVDDSTMKALNRSYRGKNKATDVLAFSMQEGKKLAQSHLLGDIVISVPTASRQAKDHHTSLEDELRTLLIHGFCHLLGYDHKTDAEEIRMQTEERRLVAVIERA